MQTSHDNQKEKYTLEEWNIFVNKQKKEHTKDEILNEIEKTRSREPEQKFQDVPDKDATAQILNKHLKDNVAIHSSDEFKETAGPKTNTAKTVTYSGNRSGSTQFILKYGDQFLNQAPFFNEMVTTVTEVIAGSLYKALLYDRAPVFKLVETIKRDYPIALKSKLLDDFCRLGQFMYESRKAKHLDLIYEKFANEDGRKELAVYMATSLHNVEGLKHFIKRCQEKMKGSEGFFANILKQLNGKGDSTKLEELSEFKNILVQIFKKLEDKRDAIANLFSCEIDSCIESANIEKRNLLNILNQLGDEDYKNQSFIEKTKARIKKIALYYKSLNTIVARLDQEEFTKKFLAEIIKEIEKAKGVKDVVIDEINQKLSGLEKVITSMLLLGYHDLHGGNIGILEKKKMYAKVDMSASFDNLEYTSYLQYITKFTDILIHSRVAKEDKVRWHAAINYSDLNDEINKACDLFIDNHGYVESLIHRALFYKKPLLRTEAELKLVNELVEKIIKQAVLLKEFANSKEFTYLKDYIDSIHVSDAHIDWVDWVRVNKEKSYDKGSDSAEHQSKNTSIIERLTKAVEDNLRIQEHPKQNPITSKTPHSPVTPSNYTRPPVIARNTTLGRDNEVADPQSKTGNVNPLGTKGSTHATAAFSSNTKGKTQNTSAQPQQKPLEEVKRPDPVKQFQQGPTMRKTPNSPVKPRNYTQPKIKPVIAQVLSPIIEIPAEDPKPVKRATRQPQQKPLEEVKMPDIVVKQSHQDPIAKKVPNHTIYAPVTGNGDQPQPRAPIHGHVAPSEPEKKKVSFADDVKTQKEPLNQQAKSKNNSNHHYIFIGAAVGLVIGLALGLGIAYIIGITLSTIATVSILIGSAVAGATLGAGVGYCVSRCFDNPNVENIEAAREKAGALVL